MIVDMYFSQTYQKPYSDAECTGSYGEHYLRHNKKVREANGAVIEYMKAMPDNTRFIFLITTSQKDVWDAWINEYELQDLIRFELPRPITNIVHKESGRRIMLYVLSKSPLKEHEYGNTNKETETCTT